MKRDRRLSGNEKGVTLILCVMLLAVLTLATVASINVSRLNINMASTDKYWKETFYSADRGMMLCAEKMMPAFSQSSFWNQLFYKSDGTLCTTCYSYDQAVTATSWKNIPDPLNANVTFTCKAWRGRNDAAAGPVRHAWIAVEAVDKDNMKIVLAGMGFGEPKSYSRYYWVQEGGGPAKTYRGKDSAAANLGVTQGRVGTYK